MSRRRVLAAGSVVLVIGGGLFFFGRDEPRPPKPWEIRGSVAWARRYYGDSNAPNFRDRHVIEIDFLGEPMYVHKRAKAHFLRLARIFRAQAPEYAAEISLSPDDWSYSNRDIRGGDSKSMHSFGIAVDINALANVLGTEGDMPEAVVEQWEQEGGEWGGDWLRPDPMHFETHLTPQEIRDRYRPDGGLRE